LPWAGKQYNGRIGQRFCNARFNEAWIEWG
jgi:hypothetical protein